MKQGYVYVMGNEALGKGVFKIGQTRFDPRQRAKELSRSTSIFGEFQVRYAIMCVDCVKAEKQAHNALSDKRVADGKEFFKTDYETAKQAVKLAVESVDNDLLGHISADMEVIKQAHIEMNNLLKELQIRLDHYLGSKIEIETEVSSSQELKPEIDIWGIINRLKKSPETTFLLPPGSAQPAYICPKPRRRIYESRIDRDIVEGYETGESLSKLARTHFGYSNGGTIAKVKRILSCFNMLKS